MIGATYEQDATESAVGGCTCLHLLSLGLWGRKAEFSPIMLVALLCANICRVDEKCAKCLKISENAL